MPELSSAGEFHDKEIFLTGGLPGSQKSVAFHSIPV